MIAVLIIGYFLAAFLTFASTRPLAQEINAGEYVYAPLILAVLWPFWAAVTFLKAVVRNIRAVFTR